MITDTLKNMEQYRGMHEGIDKILSLLSSYDSENFTPGRVTVDGDALYLNFCEYETHSAEGAQFEAHHRYADIMYIVEGNETVYVKNTDRLGRIVQAYDSEKDILFAELEADATKVSLQKGDVILLLPQDAHAPGCVADEKCHVKKIVGKVRL